MISDPYPAKLADDLEAAPLAPADPLIRAINRLAQAIEQDTLARLHPVASQPVQNVPQGLPAFTPLPPVQTVAQKPPCPVHGIEKVAPSTKFPGFYCTAKDASKPRGFCDWTLKAA
jgi:hypothetical protein